MIFYSVLIHVRNTVLCVLCPLAEDCKKKWKGLRDHYRKEKKREKDRRRSGAAGGGGRVWRYTSVMGFLDPFLEEHPSTSNLDEALAESEESRDDEGETEEYEKSC